MEDNDTCTMAVSRADAGECGGIRETRYLWHYAGNQTGKERFNIF